MDILYLSPADWHGVRGRFQHLAERFAGDGHRVLYCDGLGVRTLRVRDLPRVKEKLRAAFAGRAPVAREPLPDGVSLAHPLALPLPRWAPVKAVNRRLLRRQLARAQAEHGVTPGLVWLSYPHPDLVAILDQWPDAHVVYDCVDAWDQFAGAYPDLAAAERILLERADVVLATAPALARRLARHHPRVHHVGNGVDVARFQGEPPPPEDLAAIPGPRVGFVGNLAHWVDMPRVERLARALPDVHFVLVGPWQRPEAPPRHPNLHFLGARPYARIPAYLAHFDLCLIPFEDSPLVRAVDPLKLYEYLAAGRPVASTPLPSADPGLRDAVHWLSGDESDVDTVRRALAGDDAEARGLRRRLAAAHDWSRRYRDILAHLAAAGLDLNGGGLRHAG